jgi:predicted protein tyrosine phosphatase
MSQIHVCPLSRVEEVVAASKAEALVSLLSPPAAAPRLKSIAPGRHLVLGLADLVAPLDGHVLPDAGHVESLLAFLRQWERRRPLVIHCYAGVSRSTAAAFITLCALTPRPEIEIAQTLRLKSPTATPNRRLVALADEILSRQGRMVAAVDSIGRGADCFEGEVFWLDSV